MSDKKLSPKELFVKTLPFVWAKLIIQGLALLAGALFIVGGILLLSKFPNLGIVTLIFIAIGASAYLLIVRYLGYLVDAGHVAVLVDAVTTGSVVENQVQYGKNKVLERFATSSVFFALDRLMHGAVKQVQRDRKSVV